MSTIPIPIPVPIPTNPVYTSHSNGITMGPMGISVSCTPLLLICQLIDAVLHFAQFTVLSDSKCRISDAKSAAFFRCDFVSVYVCGEMSSRL